MGKVIESYNLGPVKVKISETDKENRLLVQCNDGEYRSEFTIRRYEFENYKRHMNQKISNAFKAPKNDE